MITIKESFTTTDGKPHPTLEDAQLAELEFLFSTNPNRQVISEAVFACRKSILEILAAEPKKARKPRTPKNETPAATT